MAGKPSLILSVKHKQDGRRHRLIAFWPSRLEGAFSGKPERAREQQYLSIKGIVLTDGSTIDVDDWWLNLAPPYDPETASKRKQAREDQDTLDRMHCRDCGESLSRCRCDDDIPF